MLVLMRMGCDWNIEERAETAIENGVFGPREGSRGLTVADPATRSIYESVERAIEKVALIGVPSFQESTMVSIVGVVPVSES